MESVEETFRLETKTDSDVVRKQALWAGIEPGMRVADICFGSGKTTSVLRSLVEPGGSVVGVDSSEERVYYARERYGVQGIEFKHRNILDPLEDLGKFDFVWVRFVLEYFCSRGRKVVENISRIVKSGGTLCLIDLDHTCMSHYGLSQRLESALMGFVKSLQEKADFDPHAGRKLYSYLYEMGYQDIKVDMSSHHLIYGELNEKDDFNWSKKLEVASRKIGHSFAEYKGGYADFLNEFKSFFAFPGRFLYTPIISSTGRKP